MAPHASLHEVGAVPNYYVIDKDALIYPDEALEILVSLLSDRALQDQQKVQVLVLDGFARFLEATRHIRIHSITILQVLLGFTECLQHITLSFKGQHGFRTFHLAFTFMVDTAKRGECPDESGEQCQQEHHKHY